MGTKYNFELLFVDNKAEVLVIVIYPHWPVLKSLKSSERMIYVSKQWGIKQL